MKLSEKVETIKGVGAKKLDCFKKLNIETVEDLINYIPRKYEDRRGFTRIDQLVSGETYYIKGELLKISGFRGRSGRSPMILKIRDVSGTLDIVYFNSIFLKNVFQIGSKYAFYGKVTENNFKLQMVQPEYAPLEDAISGIIPVYPLTKGLSQKDMRKFQTQVSPAIEDFDEWLPEELVAKNKLCDLPFAYRNIHFPKDEKSYKQSKYRLVFDELFAFQMGLYLLKNRNIGNLDGIKLKSNDIESEFIQNLDFQFTKGQQKVWTEIKKDLEDKKAMNRLVQGDVGSGKTVIAETAIFKTVKNGYQAVMMAPTEILAKQHFETFKKDLQPFGIKVALLCSSLKQSEKKKTQKDLAKGEIQVLIGTHAVVQEGVKFKKLGLVITDEQHRFGVRQRSLLGNKGQGVNTIVMTATPIPRTLAIILYGDLDISIIDTMPKGRQKIITQSFTTKQRRTAYSKVSEELDKGHQCYVVAPLIEESESIEADSVDEIYKNLVKLFPNRRVEFLHGSMKQEEKDAVMESFVKGEIDILVSTVVIEVGINVQNATVMVIENCERFGLAQLHQLRGRVGRGQEQSYCLLITKKESEISKERVKIMTETSDGMLIAEEDLKLRGPGDFFGTKQHGLPELSHANLLDHIDLLNDIKIQVEEVLTDDPELKKKENINLSKKTNKLYESILHNSNNL